MNTHVLATLAMDKLMARHPEKEHYRDVYLYGTEIILATMANSAIVILLSIILGLEREFILYHFIFIPLRLYNGGYHAKTHLQCIITYLILMLGSISLSNFLHNVTFEIYIIAFFIIICLIIQAKYIGHSGGILKNILSKCKLVLPIFMPICLLIIVLLLPQYHSNIHYFVAALCVQSVLLLKFNRKEENPI